ncbi:MAG: CoA ester lyase [Desulfobacterales bacterium]|jgi:citrate lyase subunit beta/citryl-CoA lyase|nr:CoA ester lyase [Desulfobacterales bacterium]
MKRPLMTLYTPGNRKEFVEKAAKYNPDAIIVDLEDAVPIDLKERVRWEVAELIPTLDVPCLVRINSEPQYLEEDLKAVVSRHIYGVVLPKAESVQLIRTVDDILNSLEKERSLPSNSIRLLLLIETALCVERCFEVASAAARVDTVIFASAEDGDLQRDLKCSWSVEGIELLYARSKVLLDARAAGLKYVLDGAFSDIKNDDALRKDCILSKRLGYDGRTLIHPKQLSIAREAYLPTPQELEYYKRLVVAFKEAESKGLAAISFEGRLVDYAMYRKAKEFLSN